MGAGLSPLLIASASLTYLRFLRLPLVAVAIPLVAIAVAVALVGVAVTVALVGIVAVHLVAIAVAVGLVAVVAVPLVAVAVAVALITVVPRIRKRAGCSNRRGKNRSRNTEHQVHR